MNADEYSGLAKIRLFLALSRTPHGLLDVCTPVLAALLWLGRPPDLRTSVLGIIAALAGYTAVYALNDLVDYRTDREKIRQGNMEQETGYLDGSTIRHPLARGYLSFPEAAAWTGGWGALSLVTAYLLNPVCAYILLIGCLLEAVYCLLLRVSPLRSLVSGVVKTLGGLAAVFAVDASPEPGLLLLIFFWLFFWEIGGQNIPADWHDIREDKVMRAKTIPVSLGPGPASIIAFVTLSTSLVMQGVLLRLTPLQPSFPFYAAAIGAGIYLLILPVIRLLRTRERDAASALFNRSSWYPCSLLFIMLAALLYRAAA
jgi:4-hydroxybenzoate polyprenyltransferase